MKKDGKGLSVTVWSAIALGAVGIGVIVAFLAGYLLGHFTGHTNTTTVAVVTAPAESGGEAESGEEAESGGEAEGGEEASEEAAGGETETAPTEEPATGEGEGEEAMPEEEQPQQGGGEAAAAGNAAAGAEVFATNCSVCHGADGHGGAGGPDLRTMPKAKTEAGAIEQVTNGGGGMPPFQGQLSEEEIANVAAYVVQDVVGGS